MLVAAFARPAQMRDNETRFDNYNTRLALLHHRSCDLPGWLFVFIHQTGWYFDAAWRTSPLTERGSRVCSKARQRRVRASLQQATVHAAAALCGLGRRPISLGTARSRWAEWIIGSSQVPSRWQPTGGAGLFLHRQADSAVTCTSNAPRFLKKP